jgi:hypothetical protein
MIQKNFHNSVALLILLADLGRIVIMYETSKNN